MSIVREPRRIFAVKNRRMSMGLVALAALLIGAGFFFLHSHSFNGLASKPAPLTTGITATASEFQIPALVSEPPVPLEPPAPSVKAPEPDVVVASEDPIVADQVTEAVPVEEPVALVDLVPEPAPIPPAAKPVENKAAAAPVVSQEILPQPTVVAFVELQPKPFVPTTAQFRWKKVGADPCSPQAGCTLSWALDQAVVKAGWPEEIESILEHTVLHTAPQAGQICSGWVGWMTAGKHARKFWADTLADWSLGHCEPTDQWQIQSGGFDYFLIKVHKCQNWGGWRQLATLAALPEPAPDRIPLGVVPVSYCE